jgi:hypothetical protein
MTKGDVLLTEEVVVLAWEHSLLRIFSYFFWFSLFVCILLIRQ